MIQFQNLKTLEMSNILNFFQRLVYIELPYDDDVRCMEFAPIYNENIRPSEEQLQAMGDLVDAMMLQNDEECVCLWRL